MKTIETHSEIIDHLGGRAAISKALTVDNPDECEQMYQKVWRWHHRNSIPAKYWEALIEIAIVEDIPLSYKMLAKAK